jgi:hypothetical protein
MPKAPIPTFAAKQVCAALGVPHGTLNSWAHMGFFREFDAATTTPGKARKFSLDDLFLLSIRTHLLDFGISGGRAKSWAQHCADHVKKGPPPAKLRMLLYANREEILLDDQEPGPGLMLELTIYPQMILAALKRRLAAADDPKVAAMSRRRSARERAPKRAPKREKAQAADRLE